MNFEFDFDKSEINHQKHAIDFVEAQALWNDGDLLIVPAKSVEEPRFVAIGKIAAKHWAAIYTMRSGYIRIISVRRARVEEIARYEST
jgi:uncharacterized protein